MAVFEALSEEECYLYAILQDESGLDLAEFAYTDETSDEGVFRAWPFQWPWWRSEDELQVDQGSRSSGKSLSIKFRAFAFPFMMPGEEMLITAPEGVHLDAVTDNIETLFLNNNLAREMIAKGRGGIKHRPFMINFSNGGRIIGRIPQRDGSGVKGVHPAWLEQDEACFPAGSLVMTKRGHIPIEDVLIGDEVWTHKNRWRRVLNNWNRGEKETIILSGQGHQSLEVTSNHRFLAKPVLDWKDRKNEWGPKLGDTEWIPAEYMDSAFWSSPLNLNGVDIPDSVIPRSKTGDSYDIQIFTHSFLWILGLYVAEGSVSANGKVTWSIHKKEVDHVMSLLKQAGLRPFAQPVQNSDNCMNIVVPHVELKKWISTHIHSGAKNKNIPMWIFSLEDSFRESFLSGMVYGDGCISTDERYAVNRYRYCTVSKGLAYEVRLLAQSLGKFSVVYTDDSERVMHIRDKQYKCATRYEIVISSKGQGYIDGDKIFTKVKGVSSGRVTEVFDLEVEDDHSFLVEGIIVHNSDYPEQGWIELFETLKQGGRSQSRWRAHGVTRGVGGTFDDKCKSDSGWRVHRLPAMYRPTWNEDERQAKIKQYGHQDNADYRRNILGLPGDQNSPIFVLYRLMANVDTDQSSDYNLNEYTQLTIDEANVREAGSILPFLEMPLSHLQNHKNFWIGADIGWTIAPTAIVIFGEEPAKDGTKLRLLARIMLRKIATEDQVAAIIHLIKTYRPVAFAMDSTGAGFPLLQNVQEKAREHDELRQIVDRIKGYNFSEKVIADFDERIEIDEDDPDGWKEAVIKRTVLEWSTDVLRGLVDSKRLVLPWDREMIGEFQGQTWTYAKTNLDPYGRKKIYSAGSFHSLDAARMAALAYQQNAIEELIRMKGEDMWEPPPMIFI